jgi:septal ring factor EnvC (AmiA/AmiB activator)
MLRAAIIGYFCFLTMRILVFLVFLFCSSAAMAQQQPVQYTMTRTELEAKRKEIQSAISETERQLEAIKNDKKATMGQLRALQNKLGERQRLIGNINDELQGIDKDIRNSSKEVLTLRQKLDLMRMRYVQSIRYSYETRSSYDMLAFLFSSHDFNDALRRMRYLKTLREYRKQQVEQILATQTQLQTKIGTLNAVKAQQAELLNTQVQQKQVLMQETNETNKVMQDLKGRESQLAKDIENNRRITVRVNKAINDLIEREMAKAAKAAEEAAKKTATATGATAPTATRVLPKTTTKAKSEGSPELMLTPTDIALANNFEGNKGKLYWPVEKGFISDHFGEHPHPLAPQVMVDNLGVDIRTSAHAPVRSVFEGTVSSVFTMEGRQIVMIQHGNYFTIYTGLATVSVKKDQHVSTLQTLGTVAENEEGVPTIGFQIWRSYGGKKNQVKLNPEPWLGRPR